VGFQDHLLRLKVPRSATVKVPILLGPVERTLQNRPVRLRNLGSNLLARAMPPTTDVVLRGSRQGLNRVDPESVTAFVDLAGLGAGEYTMGVRVNVPQDAGVARILPPSVQLQITSVAP
jgi:YbbR domain-containing protein